MKTRNETFIETKKRKRDRDRERKREREWERERERESYKDLLYLFEFSSVFPAQRAKYSYSSLQFPANIHTKKFLL